MALRVTDLGPGRPPTQVLGALDKRSRERGQPGPAALIGDWLGGDAVIFPSVRIDAGVWPPQGHHFWVGAISYPDRLEESAMPAVVGGVADDMLTWSDGRWSYHHLDGVTCPGWMRACVCDDPDRSDTAARWSTTWSAPPRAPHDAAVRACLDAIVDGEVYQACVCTRFVGELTGEAIDFFAGGVDAMAPRKAAYLAGDWGAIASFSPETYLRVQNREVTSSPIKGTVPATDDPATLLESVKDVAENVMIVDLVRNDLGRLAIPGSVTVPELLAVHPAPGVWHLVSTVAATLRADVTTDDLIDATFPPGSVTGTPKIRARELLQQWEDHPRGVYCGAIGVVAPDGDLDMNVAIRTVEVAPDGTIALGVGGGITIDSDPDREWQECLDKAASIVTLTPDGQRLASTA